MKKGLRSRPPPYQKHKYLYAHGHAKRITQKKEANAEKKEDILRTIIWESGCESLWLTWYLFTLDNLNGLIVDYQQHIDYRNFISQKNGKYEFSFIKW